MSKGYVLALDVGERRIGVALASLIARLPAPLTVIDRSATSDVVDLVRKIVAEHDVEVVVVGLPRGLEGQDTQQTTAVRNFASSLAGSLNVPVVMQDEAVTSIEAEKRLRARGKLYDKGDIDAEAATMILDDYLKAQVGRRA